MPEIVALIPARSGSKGLQNKNIRMLKGRPLLEWSIAACNKSELINRIIVSTDSQDYAELAIKSGAEAPFLRPEKLSQDASPDIDFVLHALNYFKINNQKIDFIVHIRPTTPLRDPKLIDNAINYFLNSDASSLRSVSEMPESAYKYFELNTKGYLKSVGFQNNNADYLNNSRQTFPKTYIPNGYVDVLSVKFIQENQLIHGNKVLPFITPRITEIDCEDDFNYLEFEVEKNPELINNLF